MHVSKKLDLNSLMSIPQIGASVEISPDKQNVALEINRIHENYDVFLASIRGATEIIPLTRTKNSTDFEDWAPDSKSILISEDTGGDQRSTLYQIYLDSPFDMRPLTPVKPEYFTQGALFNPSGDSIVYSVNYDIDRKKETETFRLIVQDLESGEKIIVARPDKPCWIDFSIDPKGKYILYSRSDEDPSGEQWWIASFDGTEDREIINFGSKAKVSADWTHDGTIAFDTDTIDGKRHDSVGIGLLNLTTEEIKWIIEPNEVEPFDGVEVPKYSQHIRLLKLREGRTKSYLYHLDHETKSDITPHRGNLVPISSISQTEWLGVYYSSTSPRNLVKFNPYNPNLDQYTFLTDMLGGSGVSESDLTPAEDFRWISVDNTMIHGWLYRPKKNNGKTILNIHGGPTWHFQDAFDEDNQYLCSLGFNVLCPNYRGSTGYGVNFRELIKKDGWGGKDKEDIRTGVQALIEKGISSPGQIGVFGTSYGGYMSWNAIVHFETDIIAAAVPICGMTDLVIDYETTRPDIRPYSEEMMGGSPTEVPEIYFERSPINFVQDIKGKLLIVQGLSDPNVTPANVDQIELKLKENSIDYEKLVFEDEGHGILREDNVKVLLTRIGEFFDSTL